MSAQTAKEPSMEDILASIRKIISEDNHDDAPTQNGTAPSPSAIASDTILQSGAAVSTSSPTNTPVERRVTPNDDVAKAAVRPDENRPMVQPEPAASPAPVDKLQKNAPIPGFVERKPISADANSGSVFQAPTKNDTAQVDSPLHPAIENAKAFVSSNIAPSGISAQTKSEETPVFENSNTINMHTSTTPLVSPDSVERREEEERRNHPLRRGADRDDQEFKNALMSPATDNMVVSAFEQLKNSATDNLDGKVEALLRPMLREWLDNNLPSMVERLVRDEIERVSRGD